MRPSRKQIVRVAQTTLAVIVVAAVPSTSHSQWGGDVVSIQQAAEQLASQFTQSFPRSENPEVCVRDFRTTGAVAAGFKELLEAELENRGYRIVAGADLELDGRIQKSTSLLAGDSAERADVTLNVTTLSGTDNQFSLSIIGSGSQELLGQPQEVMPAAEWSLAGLSAQAVHEPNEGFIIGQTAWRRFWPANRPLPEVDFSTNLVFVASQPAPKTVRVRVFAQPDGQMKVKANVDDPETSPTGLFNAHVLVLPRTAFGGPPTDPNRRIRLGVTVRPNDGNGVEISQIDDGSPATRGRLPTGDTASLDEGDIVLRCNGRAVNSVREFIDAVQSSPVTCTLQVQDVNSGAVSPIVFVLR